MALDLMWVLLVGTLNSSGPLRRWLRRWLRRCSLCIYLHIPTHYHGRRVVPVTKFSMLSPRGRRVPTVLMYIRRTELSMTSMQAYAACRCMSMRVNACQCLYGSVEEEFARELAELATVYSGERRDAI